ncbi:oligopeptide/dipeptide ABC transporter ATP-binding protein [Nocardioides sp. CN2-186]|uniref:ABC transporter ATP-binding protein n=1 Tax=Nocardioides tweenelious TaxID=3156607 RepID=UPI0032B5FA8E
MLEIEDLHVHYKVGRGRHVHAVNGVSLSLAAGESLGVVGESGCGKSTLAKAVTGLVPITSGRIALDGVTLDPSRDRSATRRVQMVFQDPTASLNPRLRVGTMLRELITVHGLHEGSDADRRAGELMELVGLPRDALSRRPREFSGGQRQRIGIARALAVEPDVLIADEAVSALDVSTQAVVIDLLDRLRTDLGLALVFISHDLGVVRAVCDRVAVMYLGSVVEQGATEALYADPRHPYTRALLDAVPRIDVVRRPGSARLPGEPPSPLDPPAGCAFHPRCPIAVDVCATTVPTPVEHGGRTASCHVAELQLGV